MSLKLTTIFLLVFILVSSFTIYKYHPGTWRKRQQTLELF